MWYRPQVVSPCSQAFSWMVCINWCDRVRTKQFLDFRRLFTGSCLHRECLGSSVYFLLSCQDVVALLRPGGAIPARRYTFSIDVGLRHPVMKRHASFRAESSLLTCVDLSHAGHAYSAVE